MDAGGEKPKKQHKKKQGGAKAKKKAEKKQGGKVAKHNAKAHTFSGGTRSVQRRVQFTLEKQAKKEHAPRVDKTPEVPPPFVVVVQGPPGVGKTTLIHSLVKHYAKQKLIQMRGPITLVSGRQRRLTIVECPQDVPSMLDLAKVADLVLLLIDASFGFELETFEFINMLQVHGFPRVIGVLTHLDGFHDNKQLRRVKKTMKHRFWSEIFDGAKLFYLSGLQYGRYHRIEVQNLARFIAVQRAAILSWRQSHPYVLALRWEDHTDPTLPETAPRKLDVYGYVYGGRLREGTQAHLAGVGDFRIAGLKALPDPCPVPGEVEAERHKAKREAGQGSDKPKRKNALRTLAERHRIIYAPGSDIGSITVDSEAMYINVAEHQVGFTAREGEQQGADGELPEAVRMVRALQSGEVSLDKAAARRAALRLVGGSTVQLAPTPSADTGAGVGAAGGEERRRRRLAPAAQAAVPLRGRRGGQQEGEGEGDADDEEDEDEGEEEEDGEEEEADGEGEGAPLNGADDAGSDDAARHRQAVLDRASERFARRPRLELAIYGPPAAPARSQGGAPAAGARRADAPTDHATVPLFEDEDEDAAAGGGAAAAGNRNAPGLLGDLGDADGVDTNRMPSLPGADEPWSEDHKEALKAKKFITGGWSSGEEDVEANGAAGEMGGDGQEGQEGQDGEAAQKGGSSGSTAAAPPGKMEKGDPLLDGVPIASFVRVRLEGVPAACVAELRRDRMLVLGGLLPGEMQMGLVQVRVKRHRWHPKLLKSGDALLLSVGWRRYQTVPTFCIEDRGEKRMRYLKYTLEHAHCIMTMYGPMVPPNAGVIAFRSWQKMDHFRIAATGGVLESAPNFNIVKKLKLVGEPYKVFRNTAFIRNMFNSDLEVSKYAHAKIQTVSGIRGEIKKAEGNRGNFRATFEDRILMSDLVVCKCWIQVQPKEFYLPAMDVAAWRPARLIGELRAVKGVPVENNRDSQYGKQFVRPERRFNPLRIPKALEASLPFKTKPKLEFKKRKNPLRRKAAIVSSERERAINSLLQRLYTVKKEKQRIRREASAKKRAVKEKREQYIQQKREVVKKEARKKRYIKEGKSEGQKRKALRLD